MIPRAAPSGSFASTFPSTPVLAFVRCVGPAFRDALREHAAAAGGEAPLDPELARRQQEDYIVALREAGVRVEILPPLEGAADACFVEDTAVVVGAASLLCRPGTPTRREEVESMAAPLAGRLAVSRMASPARLDGGDVLRVDATTLLVGRSDRTDDAGIAALRRFAIATGQVRQVIAFDVGRGLHLKSGLSMIAAGQAIVDPAQHEPSRVREILGPLGVDVVEAPEPVGANVIALRDRVLVSAEAVGTIATLRAGGHDVRPVPLSALHAADAGLTCLSLRVPAPGEACT